jgi:hypothetical protein
MSISPSLVASRITGVAPLAVHFDASGTTSSETSRPFHDVYYSWDFGDPAGGATWSYGARSGLSKNAARGPISVHVFETPSTYTVSLLVFDGVSLGSISVEVVVDDPDVVFSGINTICFSTSGTFTGAPSGASEVTTSDWDSAINTYIASGKRLLFRRGETFSFGSDGWIDVDGPGTIGAFGSGAKPIVSASVNGIKALAFGLYTAPGLNDWRIMDLDITGNGNNAVNAVACYEGNVGQMNQMLLLRCDMHNMGAATSWSEDILDYWNGAGGHPGHTIFDEIFLVECTTANILGGDARYSFFGSAHHLGIVGCDLDNDGTGSHSVRITHTQKAVISNNRLAGAGATHHVIKLHAYLWGSAGVSNPDGVGTYSEQIVISDNDVVGGSEAWTIAIGPQDGGSDERVRNVIYERNMNNGASANQVQVIVWASEITARNNLLNVSAMAAKQGIIISRRGIEPASDLCRVLANTFYSSASDNDFIAVELGSSVTNITVKNNLGYAPSDSNHVLLNGTGASGLSASNNSSTAQVGATSPNFTSGSPVNPVDFQITAGSYAIGAGVDTAKVWDDFFGSIRDWSTPNTDIGFHAFTQGELPGGNGGGAPFKPQFAANAQGGLIR